MREWCNQGSEIAGIIFDDGAWICSDCVGRQARYCPSPNSAVLWLTALQCASQRELDKVQFVQGNSRKVQSVSWSSAPEPGASPGTKMVGED